MKTIAEKITYLKKQHSLSYKDLADTIGNITPDGIRKAITKNNIKHTHLNKLCKKYSWNKDWILRTDTPETKDKIILAENKEDLEILIKHLVKSEIENQCNTIKNDIADIRKDLTTLMLRTLK